MASNSPRRRQLLLEMGYEFDIIPSTCDEITTAIAPRDIVKELACRKALNVYSANNDGIVIGCDTVVDFDGKVLGKPQCRAEAARMLKSLSGRSHFVHTGVCVACRRGFWLFCVTTLVEFKTLSSARIKAYIETNSPMDKAGAYGIQDSDFVKKINGSYTNVMGFPTDEIDIILKEIYKG